MRNGEMMNLRMTRLEMCDLMLATTNIVVEARTEMNDPDTTETRKKILEGTIEKWTTLHDKISEQIKQFDEEYDRAQQEAETARKDYRLEKFDAKCNRWCDYGQLPVNDILSVIKGYSKADYSEHPEIMPTTDDEFEGMYIKKGVQSFYVVKAI